MLLHTRTQTYFPTPTRTISDTQTVDTHTPIRHTNTLYRLYYQTLTRTLADTQTVPTYTHTHLDSD